MKKVLKVFLGIVLAVITYVGMYIITAVCLELLKANSTGYNAAGVLGLMTIASCFVFFAVSSAIRINRKQ